MIAIYNTYIIYIYIWFSGIYPISTSLPLKIRPNGGKIAKPEARTGGAARGYQHSHPPIGYPVGGVGGGEQGVSRAIWGHWGQAFSSYFLLVSPSDQAAINPRVSL